MKKLLSFFVAGIIVISSTFAFGLSTGADIQIGSCIDSFNETIKNKGDGLVYGGGFYINADCFKGLGIQTEANFCSSQTKTGNNISMVDIPLMAWYNLTCFDRFVIGAGAGLNVCVITNNFMDDVSNISRCKLGLASGANIKFFFTKHLGFFVGANGVFEFSNRANKEVINKALEDSFQGEDEGISSFFTKTRKTVCGKAGFEFRFI